jgi:hypothetical protein
MIAKFFLSLFGATLIIEKLEAEIKRLVEDNQDLRDRLFVKHQLPVTGTDLHSTMTGEPVQGYLTPKQRLAALIASTEPPIAAKLSESEMEYLRKVAQ